MVVGFGERENKTLEMIFVAVGRGCIVMLGIKVATGEEVVEITGVGDGEIVAVGVDWGATETVGGGEEANPNFVGTGVNNSAWSVANRL